LRASGDDGLPDRCRADAYRTGKMSTLCRRLETAGRSISFTSVSVSRINTIIRSGPRHMDMKPHAGMYIRHGFGGNDHQYKLFGHVYFGIP
jgi:hypothetical protein